MRILSQCLHENIFAPLQMLNWQLNSIGEGGGGCKRMNLIDLLISQIGFFHNWFEMCLVYKLDISIHQFFHMKCSY